MKEERTTTLRRIIIVLAGALALTSCAAPGNTTALPSETPGNRDLQTCIEVSEGDEQGRFWEVVEYFGAYASNRDSVGQTDAAEAIATLDELSADTTGDLAASFDGMRTVLEDIEARYIDNDPLAPVDYQVFQDEANAMFDACIALIDNE
jgi:hypothetical protein